MSAYRIVRGRIVTPSQVIEQGTIAIENGKISEISADSPIRIGDHDIDADGQWVLPGFIDSHSDAIETEIQPRVRAVFDIEFAVRELERKLAACGITTMYHALGLSEAQAKRDVRTKEAIGAILSAIDRLRRETSLIRHRVHLRFEITNTEMADFVEQLIGDRSIHQLSFTDHTPGQGQYRNHDLYRQNAIEQLRVPESEAGWFVRTQTAKAKVDGHKLKLLADLANRHGIPIASHDDDTVAKLIWATEHHARISEFPIELQVAKEAKRRGLYVAMGAPNVLLGRSSSHNLSALEAIREGAVDMLCSDYYPSSLLLAVFELHRMGYDMPYAANMASLHPAQALGIDRHLGSIEQGKEADILLVREDQGTPFLTRTLVAGEEVCRMSYRRIEAIHESGK